MGGPEAALKVFSVYSIPSLKFRFSAFNPRRINSVDVDNSMNEVELGYCGR